jgi:hypothetical protein
VSYCELTDINVHLPLDKVQITDGEDDNFQIDAQRLIRARLGSVFSLATLDGWSSPSLTPEIIREIAGKLIAAKYYAILVAEDEADGSKFAQDLYNEAISMINDIRNGVLTVIDVSGNELSNDSLTETSFWPNATTQEPSFSVAEVWS